MPNGTRTGIGICPANGEIGIGNCVANGETGVEVGIGRNGVYGVVGKMGKFAIVIALSPFCPEGKKTIEKLTETTGHKNRSPG